MATKAVGSPPKSPPAPPGEEQPPEPGRNPRPTPPPNTVYVRCRMPSIMAWTDYDVRADGRIVEVTCIWALKGLWAGLPFAREAGWTKKDFGLFWLTRKTIE